MTTHRLAAAGKVIIKTPRVSRFANPWGLVLSGRDRGRGPDSGARIRRAPTRGCPYAPLP